MEVDVVVVSYNSRTSLCRCIVPLVGVRDINVIVVDNDSTDDSLDAIAELLITAFPSGRNGGFAFGCNLGWRMGRAPFVLFLNPDAAIAPEDVDVLAGALEQDPGLGAVGPRIENQKGSLEYSQRRFPTIRSTFAQALYLHRVFPFAEWSDQLMRDPDCYERRGEPDWVSGACIMVRRAALVAIDGFDERFFMYSEDTDLCWRLREHGHRIGYTPFATCAHSGGASAPRPCLLPVLAASRVYHARKHRSLAAATLEQCGLAIGAFVRIVVSRGGFVDRLGHLRSFFRLLSRHPRLTPDN